ncbi:MAG: chemotaxis protein CheX [Candidatus Sericytochromatia bacterium]
MISHEQFIDAIVAACSEIFEMMLPMTMSDKMSQRPLPFEYQLKDIQDDMIASIGLTGEYNGTISLYLPLPLALDMAGWLMEASYTELCSEVYEAVGEIINMIAGGLKNRLSSNEHDIFDVSIPIMISGKDKQVYHGKNKEYILVPIDTDKGLFFISLVLDKH